MTTQSRGAVPFAQLLSVHARNEVGGPVQIVAAGLAGQAALEFQLLMQLRAGNGLQQADHRRQRRFFADEFQGVLETPERIRKLRV